MTLNYTKTIVDIAHPAVKVFHNPTYCQTTVYNLYADSPLPDSRLPNGNSLLGPSGRPGSWGSINWANGPTGGAVAGLGKPPPGRDPKSRARSRDFLKQLVPFLSVVRPFSLSYQMPPRNNIFDFSPGNESSTESTVA